MQRLINWLVVAALTSSFLGFLPFQTQRSPEILKAHNSPPYAPGILIVGLTSAGKDVPVAALEQDLQAQKVAALPQINTILLQVPPGQEQQAALLARKNPAVAFAEPDYAIAADSVSTPGRIPDDPFFDQQWSLQKIGLPRAWQVTTGSPDVLIAIIDSGLQLDHPDLADKIWTHPDEIPGNHLDDDGNGKIGRAHV
jgi:subtilisin family serine protease